MGAHRLRGFRNMDAPELFVIAEKPVYEAVRLFLVYMDDLVPDVRKDLKGLRPFMTSAVTEVLDAQIDHLEPRYPLLRSHGANADCEELADRILAWARKHHLVDRMTKRIRFIEIGLQWLYLDLQVTDEEHDAGTEIMLSDAVQLDVDMSSDLLKEKEGHTSYWENYFDQNYPVVFSPPVHRRDPSMYTKGRYLAAGEEPRRVLDEMSGCLGYERWKSELLADLDSERTRSRARRASVPYSIGRAYHPEEEKWDDFEKEMMHNFSMYLQAYKEVIENICPYEEIPEKQDLDKHLKWLVLFQVLGQKEADIADEFFVHEMTVSKSLKYPATLIGLERRKQKRGKAAIPDMRSSLEK